MLQMYPKAQGCSVLAMACGSVRLQQAGHGVCPPMGIMYPVLFHQA